MSCFVFYCNLFTWISFGLNIHFMLSFLILTELCLWLFFQYMVYTLHDVATHVNSARVVCLTHAYVH